MATRAVRRAAPAQPRTQRAPLRVVQGRADSTKKKKKARRSPVPVVLLVVLTVFGVAALQAWVGQDGLNAATLEREVQQEQERLTLLRAQVAQLGSPQRLRDEARKLGLVPAPDPRFLRVPVPADGAETGWPPRGLSSNESAVAAEGLAAPAP